jgi:hypothetical protein
MSPDHVELFNLCLTGFCSSYAFSQWISKVEYKDYEGFIGSAMSRVNRELFNRFFLEVKQPLSLRGHCGLLSFHSHVAEANDKTPDDHSPDRVSALPDCCGYKCGDDDFEYEGDHGVTALKTNYN